MSDVYVVHSAGRGITFYNTMGNNNLSFQVALCNGTGVTFEFTGSPVMDPASDPAYERAQYFIYGVSYGTREDVSSGTVFCNATTLPTKSNPLEGFGGGLSIIFRGNACGNSISFLSMFATLFNRAAISGGGVFIGHFDHSSENAVQYEPNNLDSGSYSLSHNMAVTDNNASITIANESCLNACLGVGGGVSVVFCGMSNNNNVTFWKSFKLHGNAVVLGSGGMFIGHFDNSFRNTVILEDKFKFSYIMDNVVIGVLLYTVSDAEHYFKNLYRFKLCGVGLLVYHCDQSHSSKLNMTSVMLINNTAEAGGGMCAIYKDSSNRHQMSHNSVVLANSILQNWQTSASNIANFTLVILYNNIAKGLVGGGISVMDWKNSADYLKLSFCKFINNVATYGAAISVLSFPSYQVRNSTMDRVIFGPNNRFYANISNVDLDSMQQLMNNFTWADHTSSLQRCRKE